MVASVVTTTLGADTQLQDGSLVGGSIATGRRTFVASTGHGFSDDLAVSLFVRHPLFKQGYVSGALTYGWHDVGTYRDVIAGAIDELTAKYHAFDLGGRMEGGYDFALNNESTPAPFAAIAGDLYHQPTYSDSSSSNDANYAAAYAEFYWHRSHRVGVEVWSTSSSTR